ncbi:exopolysaccharide biosynthesis protein [Pontivivens insulae]|uniref:Exopolysaccharide synthesis, ExoD n=1 Tax=Pontivivens insulae TaxID=1639689 RepID=A0A2R8AF89_9RHOB|nr:exopolysaccharide biosynthesis protein [Pontivivens insulae]RED12136.1 hypothetical protein DFR53_2850 [Pontivivens insulae]SPF30892.1 hypothetical protein POI8812_03237 [Pontivivens insulae]
MESADRVTGVLDVFAEDVEEHGTTVGAVVRSFEDRPLGVGLVIVGAFLMIPLIGGIPGAPDIGALLILLLVVHSWFNDMHIWLPRRVRTYQVDPDRFDAAMARLRPWAARLDTVVSRRADFLVSSAPARLVISVICVVLALAIFVLSLIPFAMMPAAAAVFLFGLALIGRDGLLAGLGYAFTLGTGYLIVAAWPF